MFAFAKRRCIWRGFKGNCKTSDQEETRRNDRERLPVDFQQEIQPGLQTGTNHRPVPRKLCYVEADGVWPKASEQVGVAFPQSADDNLAVSIEF
jgi:hypothetical protein